MALMAAQPDESVLALNQPPRIRMASPHDEHMAATLTTPIMVAPQPLDVSGMMSGAPSEPDVPTTMSAKVNSPSSPSGIMARNQDRLLSMQAKMAEPGGGHTNPVAKFLHKINMGLGWPQYEEQQQEDRVRGLQKEQTAEDLQEAQAGEANARADVLRNPPKKEPAEQRPFTLSTDKGELQYDPTFPGDWRPIEVNGETAMAPEKGVSPKSLQHVAGTGADGKQVFANYHPDSGQFTDQAGNVIPNFRPADKALQGVLGQYAPVRMLTSLLQMAYNENPALLPMIGPLAAKIMSQYGAGNAHDIANTISTPPAGQPESEGGTPIGLRMPGAPTGATRTRGQFASEVLPTMQEASGEIDRLGDKLGPFAGRYSDLVTSRIGAFGPEFSALQTDLHNIASGWGRLHGNSVETMKLFYDDLNASKDPANLKSKLERYERQAELYKRGGEGRPDELNAPPRPAGVPENAHYITDPKTGKKGWAW